MANSVNISELKGLQNILKYEYGLVPIVAGADKFINLLAQWDEYLAPGLVNIIPFSATTFMMIVGVVEIIAGILVLAKTELGAYIVSSWLVLIGLTLIFSGQYIDVAVRDIVMAVGAYILAKLTPVVASKTRSETAPTL